MTRRRSLPALALAVVLGGCAAGARRSVPASRGGDDFAPRSGYATFSSRVRLRVDSPSLTDVLEARRPAPAPTPSFGPAGEEGESVVYVDARPPCDSSETSSGPSGAGVTGYGPSGAVPPGLRTPHDGGRQP